MLIVPVVMRMIVITLSPIVPFDSRLDKEELETGIIFFGDLVLQLFFYSTVPSFFFVSICILEFSSSPNSKLLSDQ